MEIHKSDQHHIPPAPSIPTITRRNVEIDRMAILKAKLDTIPLSKQRMRQKAMQFVLVGAIEEQDVGKVQRLIEDGVDVDAQIIFTRTPLTHAIELHHNNIALQLLENGCDPNLCVDEFPNSQPIHLAARENLPTVIEKLIEMNVDINAYDKDGMAPLHIASYCGKADAVTTLVDGGADINMIDCCNRTPLHRAIESGSVDVTKLLIDFKVDLNITDKMGWTPLHLAIALDRHNIFLLLLENNCHVDIPDINGRTPLSVACDYLNRGNVDIVRRTQFHYEGRTIDFLQGRYLSLLQSSREEKERLQTVMSLINVGADVDGRGLLPISVASKADHADTVCVLMNSGAQIPECLEGQSHNFLSESRMLQIADLIKNQYLVQLNLLWQCKRRIRKLLSLVCNDLDNGINTLPLPPSMKTFLK